MVKPTKLDLENARTKTVSDILLPNLQVVFVGINPGLYTAAVGHHFGRPGNRFWKVLYKAGLTPHLFDPSEQEKLLSLGIGITNMVARTTAKADELSKEEIIEGGKILEEKVLKYKPKILAILGVGVYRIAFQKPKAIVGLQKEKIGETSVFILPNLSGLQAYYKENEMVEMFKEMKEFLAHL